MKMISTLLLGAMALTAVSAATIGSSCSTNADCTDTYNTNLACCTSGLAAGLSGFCIDTRYQFCCNAAEGVACKHYQSCCGTTCCSSRESCVSKQVYNGTEDACTFKESWTGSQIFIAIIFPIILAIGAILSFIFAVLVVFLYKVRFTFPAISVAVMATIVFIFSFCLLLSPHSLPAMFICLVASLCIASLASTSSPLAPSAFVGSALVLSAVSFLLVTNPLASNSIWSFSPAYNGGTGGVVGHLLSMTSPEALADANSNNYLSTGFYGSCPSYYLGYFRRDVNLYTDSMIYDGQEYRETYGLCSRSYLLWNVICATVLTAFIPLLILTLVARLLEVRGANGVVVTGTVTKVHPDVQMHAADIQ